MRRAVLICAVLAVLSPTCAEAAERIWRLGLLTLSGTAGSNAMRSIMLPYLATRGFVEGRNLIVDFSLGYGGANAGTGAGAGWQQTRCNSRLTIGPFMRARAATTTIPIVASPMGADPVDAGVAESWAHPGGNVTGVCLIAPKLEAKRLSLLHEALPSARRVAVMAAHRKIVEAGFPALAQGCCRGRTGTGRNLGREPKWVLQPPLTRCAVMAWKPS